MRAVFARAAAAVAGLFIVLGVSAALATPASADPAVTEPVIADGCVYAGQQYSEGAIVKVGDLYIQCVFGSWSRI